MRVRVIPGGAVGGETRVPGDKSIAHRWLILAATARGRSRLGGLPRGLDTISTATCLARIAPAAGPALEAWASSPGVTAERHGSTWNREPPTIDLPELEGQGRGELAAPGSALDCGNSGTTMRLLAGLVSGAPFTTVLVGDDSLSRRPMERVARPLREMGADVVTEHGRPPLVVSGGDLRGIAFATDVPSAQVKGSVLLAALSADGTTSVTEPAPTRDHTERLLQALGAPVRREGGRGGWRTEVAGPFQHDGFGGTVPGDVSSASFVLAAAALTGEGTTVRDVGLNPSRLAWAGVMERMGVRIEHVSTGEEVGEPVGELHVAPGATLRPVRVAADELPLVIDEVPVLAAVAAHAPGGSRFEGGAELRLKESDRLTALVEGIRALGGDASLDGDDLVVAGGGLGGGTASAAGDHRIAMALVIAALAASAPSVIEGVEVAEVSFPGFLASLRSLGAHLEEP